MKTSFAYLLVVSALLFSTQSAEARYLVEMGGYNLHPYVGGGDGWESRQSQNHNPFATVGQVDHCEYFDGYNLYEYVHAQPVCLTDPSGTFGVPPGSYGDCSYYRGMCSVTSGFANPCQKAYYCAAANAVCNMAGNGPWRDCVRTCLQCRDKGNKIPDNQNPVFGLIMGCVVKLGVQAVDHLACFTQCRWDTSSYKNGDCPCN